MINLKDNPVAWALFLMSLDDAREHLDELIKKMNASGAIDEADFAVDLGHVYAHLNRVWHTRNHTDELTDHQREQFSLFPKDLEVIG